VTFGGGQLNRAAELRGDKQEMRRLEADPRTRILALWRGKPLVRQGESAELVWLERTHALLAHASGPRVFLGLEADSDAALFAFDVSDWEPEGKVGPSPGFLDVTRQHFPDFADDIRFVELRSVMAEMTPLEAELAATGRSLAQWHRGHRFCPNCSSETEPVMAGWERTCAVCGRRHFPRTDPVVIMLVTHGNSVLLGRSHGWPEGMYSLLAGFVEPGETIEAAVRREVFEEVGVRVGRVGYLASQPWPFPASLMIGCRGEALGRRLIVDDGEIDDALWLSREEALDAISGHRDGLFLARRGSIAQFLLYNWLADRLD